MHDDDGSRQLLAARCCLLAVESGTGAELRFPLGICDHRRALLLSQLLTLYTTPGDLSWRSTVINRSSSSGRLAARSVPEIPQPPVAGRHGGDAMTRAGAGWHRSPSRSSPGRSAPRCSRSGCFLIGRGGLRISAGGAGSECRFPFDRAWAAPTRPRSRSVGDGPQTSRLALGTRLGEIAGVDQITSTSSSSGNTSNPICNSRSAATLIAPLVTCRAAINAGRFDLLFAERFAVAAAVPQSQNSAGRARLRAVR